MTLQDLEPGQAVTLEIIWGDSHYEIPTQVMGSNQNGLLVKPFSYKGIDLDLMSSQYEDMFFSIYGLDLNTGNRMVWKNVSIKSIIHNGANYYVVQVNAFKNQAASSERRNHNRLSLDLIGYLSLDREGEYLPIQLKDISDNGISFFMDTLFDLENTNLFIHFEDVVRGNFFDLDITCRVVRVEPDEEDKFLYGCKIIESGKEMLAYVCLRRMVLQAMKKNI